MENSQKLLENINHSNIFTAEIIQGLQDKIKTQADEIAELKNKLTGLSSSFN